MMALLVIAGFQGLIIMVVSILGRGGSDTTAVALGIALHADYVDIYKDVPGVAKADPHVIPNAQFMSFLIMIQCFDWQIMERACFMTSLLFWPKILASRFRIRST